MGSNPQEHQPEGDAHSLNHAVFQHNFSSIFIYDLPTLCIGTKVLFFRQITNFRSDVESVGRTLGMVPFIEFF